jgi:hypothetical protein
MLLHDGEQLYTGDPEEAVMRYFRLNFTGAADIDRLPTEPDIKLVDVWLEDKAGRRVENVEQRRPIGFNLVAEAQTEVIGPRFGFQVLNVDGVPVFGFGGELSSDREEHDRIAPGQRVRVAAAIDNKLVPGRYSITCSISRNHSQADLLLRDVGIVDFVVTGTEPNPGMVSVETDLVARLEP